MGQFEPIWTILNKKGNICVRNGQIGVKMEDFQQKKENLSKNVQNGEKMVKFKQIWIKLVKFDTN